MTDIDLATVRDWCRANGVEVVKIGPSEWGAKHVPDYFRESVSRFDSDSEIGIYKQLWDFVGPWIASVRNLHGVEVAGPYEAYRYEEHSNLWCVNGRGRLIGNLSEQSARRIAGILNRECGDGK